jgi:spermidine synthase
LIIGGGDGGVLREAVKHSFVEEIYLVDIDKMVTDVSKKYLPSLPNGAFSDKRVKVLHEDAMAFVRNYKNYFDVIIDDLTDLTGPSLDLWSAKFYQDIKNALKKDGVAGFQTAYIHENFAKRSRENLKKVFPKFIVHKAFVGCFPFDEHTFSFCSKTVDFRKFTKKTIKGKFDKLKIKTKYYSPEIHFASKIFPPYLAK